MDLEYGLSKVKVSIPAAFYIDKWKDQPEVNHTQWMPQRDYDLFVGNRVRRSKNDSRLASWLNSKGKRVYITDHSVHNREIMYKGSPARVRTTDLYINDPNHIFTTYDFGSSVLDLHIGAQQSVYRQFESNIDNDELITQALAEANARQFDLGTFLGELPETIGYLVDVVVRFWKVYQLFRKKGLPGTLRAFKAASKEADNYASLWLEYRYAIMPLFYSARDALKALEPPEMEFRRTTAKDKDSWQFEKLIDCGDFSYLLKQEVNEEVRVKVYTFMSAEQSRSAKVLLNPLTTAWELIPLSFVVDWFIGVGDFIASFDCVPFESRGLTVSRNTLATSTLSSSNPSTFTIAKHRDDGVRIGAKRSAVYSGGDSITIIDYNYERVANPTISHEIPIGVNLNWKRALDAVSLAQVLFGHTLKKG